MKAWKYFAYFCGVRHSFPLHVNALFVCRCSFELVGARGHWRRNEASVPSRAQRRGEKGRLEPGKTGRGGGGDRG